LSDKEERQDLLGFQAMAVAAVAAAVALDMMLQAEQVAQAQEQAAAALVRLKRLQEQAELQAAMGQLLDQIQLLAQAHLMEVMGDQEAAALITLEAEEAEESMVPVVVAVVVRIMADQMRDNLGILELEEQPTLQCVQEAKVNLSMRLLGLHQAQDKK
jgi:hypothetical protein